MRPHYESASRKSAAVRMGVPAAALGLDARWESIVAVPIGHSAVQPRAAPHQWQWARPESTSDQETEKARVWCGNRMRRCTEQECRAARSPLAAALPIRDIVREACTDH